MIEPAIPPPMSDGPQSSPRMHLARVARDAALGVPGVTGLSPGPTGLVLTADGQHRIDGVRCLSISDGSYDVSLSLVCALVPLLELSASVRRAVLRAAGLAGIAVADIDVSIVDVIEPGMS